jgi:hypothetical protein
VFEACVASCAARTIIRANIARSVEEELYNGANDKHFEANREESPACAGYRRCVSGDGRRSSIRIDRRSGSGCAIANYLTAAARLPRRRGAVRRQLVDVLCVRQGECRETGSAGRSGRLGLPVRLRRMPVRRLPVRLAWLRRLRRLRRLLLELGTLQSLLRNPLFAIYDRQSSWPGLV